MNDSPLPTSSYQLTPIHASFEQIAELPDLANHVALQTSTRSISYEELNALAASMAFLLYDQFDITAGDIVAVSLPRDESYVVAILAALKCAATFVPIDPAYPECYRIQILQRVKPKLLIVSTLDNTIIWEPILYFSGDLNCFPSAGQIYKRSALSIWATATDCRPAAYIIFTSGSTGEPKGVVIDHEAVRNTIEWVNRKFSIDFRDKILCVSSFCFDLSIYDIFGSLSAGATLRLAACNEISDPQTICDIINTESVSVWNSAPGLLLPVVETYLCNDNRLIPQSLRIILLSGDWIPLSLAKNILALTPKSTLVALGGATEAAIWSNYFVVHYVHDEWASIPYGQPIVNCSYHILDDDLTPCPTGKPGDLYIAGSCLARGYLGQKKLTEANFPTLSISGQLTRVYRTGDRAKQLQDGTFIFLGREDGFQKIRGFRIDISMIDGAMQKIAGILQSVTVIAHIDSTRKVLVSYVKSVSSEGAEHAREQLKQHLPAYMIPDRIVRIDKYPLSSNGKIDRSALSSRDVSMCRFNYAGFEGSSVVENTLLAAWQAVLNIRNIELDDDFFELGGHSLLASQISVVTRFQSPSYLVSPREILEAKTIRALAARISNRPELNRTSTLLEETWVPKKWHEFLCKRLRHELLSLNHNTVSFEVFVTKEHLCLEALRRTVSELYRNNEALRLTIDVESDRLIYSCKPYDPNLHTLHIFDLEGDSFKGKLEDHEFYKSVPHSLLLNGQSQLSRFYLLKSKNSRPFRVFFIAHHWILDGYGLDLIQIQFHKIYCSLVNDGIVPALDTASSSEREWRDALSAMYSRDRVAVAEYYMSRLPYFSSLDTATAPLEMTNLVPHSVESDKLICERIWNGSSLSFSDKVRFFSLLQGISTSSHHPLTEMHKICTRMDVAILDVILLSIYKSQGTVSSDNQLYVDVFNSNQAEFLPADTRGVIMGDMTICQRLLLGADFPSGMLEQLARIREIRRDLPHNGATLFHFLNENIDTPGACYIHPKIQVNFFPYGMLAEENRSWMEGFSNVFVGETKGYVDSISESFLDEDRIHLNFSVLGSRLHCIPIVRGYCNFGCLRPNENYRPERVLAFSANIIANINSIFGLIRRGAPDSRDGALVHN